MTPASDVYSFAILMYEMFTRKHLFKGLLQSQVRLPKSFSPSACPGHLLCLGGPIMWSIMHTIPTLQEGQSQTTSCRVQHAHSCLQCTHVPPGDLS